MLVEGVSDRAAIIAAAALGGIDLEALGVAVLAVDGKTKMDRPATIFTSLEIPTFLVWDCDKKPGGAIDGVEQNRALQMLMGIALDQVADATTTISGTFACFETKLESVVKEELGAELYKQQLDAVKEKYAIERSDDAEKAPFAMREVLMGAAAQGKRSATLSGIIKAIQELRNAMIIEETPIIEEETIVEEEAIRVEQGIVAEGAVGRVGGTA